MIRVLGIRCVGTVPNFDFLTWLELYNGGGGGGGGITGERRGIVVEMLLFLLFPLSLGSDGPVAILRFKVV